MPVEADETTGQLAGEGETHPETGTRRVDLWREQTEGTGTYGDDACGYALTARYVSDDGHGCGDLAYYVERIDGTDENGSPTGEDRYVVTECWTAGEAVPTIEEGCSVNLHGGDEVWTVRRIAAFDLDQPYLIEHRNASGKQIDRTAWAGLDEIRPTDGSAKVRPSDQADIEYDAAGALIYDTLTDAQREADRLGRIDWSFAIYLRKPAVTT